MTKDEILERIAKDAKKYNMTQYEAAMVLYTQQSVAENNAKKTKERLKDIIQTALKRNDEVAHAVYIPDSDKMATAYQYTQPQPRWSEAEARKACTPEQLSKFFSYATVECFTVVVMDEDTAKARVDKSNAGKVESIAAGAPSPSKGTDADQPGA